MSNPTKRGAALFKAFLAASRQSQVDAARAVAVSAVTVHHWLHGRILPRTERRQALAEWSRGAVPVESWDQPATAADLAMAAAAQLSESEVEVLHDGAVTPVEGAA